MCKIYQVLHAEQRSLLLWKLHYKIPSGSDFRTASVAAIIAALIVYHSSNINVPLVEPLGLPLRANPQKSRGKRNGISEP
jgi:hypothetical protein